MQVCGWAADAVYTFESLRFPGEVGRAVEAERREREWQGGRLVELARNFNGNV